MTNRLVFEWEGFQVPQAPLWVFGYGSLMWNPDFEYDETYHALLHGYHRKFCIYSVRYRGSYERPGLVLGLHAGGRCRGIAFRVPLPLVQETLKLLWAREMPRGVYVPRYVPIRLSGKYSPVMALTFVANTLHEHFVPELPQEQAALLIANASGERGANAEYLQQTLDQLERLGVRDKKLEQLAHEVEQIQTT